VAPLPLVERVPAQPVGAVQDDLGARQDEPADVLGEEKVHADREGERAEVGLDHGRPIARREHPLLRREQVDLAVGVDELARGIDDDAGVVALAAHLLDHVCVDVGAAALRHPLRVVLTLVLPHRSKVVCLRQSRGWFSVCGLWKPSAVSSDRVRG